ncbi:PLG [Mytilus coruscus]|uniref:PLG n=1 Tax=Mytilus coruscus TaxID=42192 RepID=A0A6J8AAV8_MYTCO|nr:PLG [Mytilus coruscus]
MNADEDIRHFTEQIDRNTDEDLEHSTKQMDRNTDERTTQSKEMRSEYKDEGTQDVFGYTDLTRSSLQDIAGYDTLEDQNNGYTELRKSISSKDQYDILGEHNIYDYSTVSDSTTKTGRNGAVREDSVDCPRDYENKSGTSGQKYRNIAQQNLKYYNKQLHIYTGNKHSLDAAKSEIRKQISEESSVNNEPDYSYVRGFTERQNETTHVQNVAQTLIKDFVSTSRDNDTHQDMPREECVSKTHNERTTKSNNRPTIIPRARLIGVAIVVLAIFFGCLSLVLSLKGKPKNNCNSPGLRTQSLGLTGLSTQPLKLADCYQTNSTQYFGTINYTVSGRACQTWSRNFPHVAIFLPDNDEDRNTNYCRDNHYYTHGTPWCYTEDPDFRWEFCPVFKCNDCTMPQVAKPGTTVSYNITYGIVTAVYTCQSFKPGVSVPHCPISTCSNGNHWSEFNTSCSVEDRYLNSTTYDGKVSCTVNGTPCMIWNLQKNSLLPINSDDHVTNYCRDPDGKGQPWCYVDTTYINHQINWLKWEFCYVPKR